MGDVLLFMFVVVKISIIIVGILTVIILVKFLFFNGIYRELDKVLINVEEV